MKKIFILIVSVVLLSSTAFAAVEPEKIDSMVQNDYILTEMLPNPNVFLYGTDSNGYPILLMDFSSTIPFFVIEDNYKILPKIGRYCSWFRKKVGHLQFFSLYLKIEPTIISNDGKRFDYKILKMQCDEKSQNIQHTDTNRYKGVIKPQYNGADAGSGEAEFTRVTLYDEKRPIIAYSGVGSDTLKILLKKGKKFRIPSGHIDTAMVVIAVPNYINASPNGYINDLKNSSCNKTLRRSICFGKTYMDNRIKNYYEVSPSHNPNGIDISSEIIPGNRINCNINTTSPCQVSIAPANQSATKPSLVLDDSDIMYNNIFVKQIPNTYSLYWEKDNNSAFNNKIGQ